MKKILVLGLCLLCLCGCGNNKKYGEITEKEIETLLDEELYVMWNKEKIEDVTNNERLTLAIKKYAKNNNLDYYDLEKVKKSDVEEAFKTTSIGTLSLNHQNVKGSAKITTCEHNQWVYNANKEIYTNTMEGHGVCAVSEAYHKLISLEEKKGKYIAVYKFIFEYSCEGDNPIPFYGSYEDALNNRNKLDEIDGYLYDTLEEYDNMVAKKYEDIKDSLMTYTYTFEKIDGKITLVDFNRK